METHIEELDLQRNPEILKEFQTTEWSLSDTEHFGEVSRDYTKKRFLYLARVDDVISAYIVLETNMGVATIEVVIVKLSEHGQAIGKQLIKHVIERARDKECHVIKLETGVSWKARLVYEKMGFKIRAVLPNYYGNQEYVLMDMKLSDSY
ncbi:MAG: GNAT family N-acetyltransferase [Patescibacteria group bacterium]